MWFLRPFREKPVDPVAGLLAEAAEHQQAGRLALAERLYCEVLGVVPGHCGALHLLGGLYLQAEKPKQALPVLEKALQIETKNPEVLNKLGLALRKIGRGEKAAMRFREALEIDPAYVEALTNLGDVLLEQGNLEAAADCYEKALGYKADYGPARSHLAVVLGRMHDASMALKAVADRV